MRRGPCLLVALVACAPSPPAAEAPAPSQPSAAAPAGDPSPSPPPPTDAEANPPAAKPPKPPAALATPRDVDLDTYTKATRSTLVQRVKAACPKLAAHVPKVPADPWAPLERPVRVLDDGGIVVVVMPDSDGFDDEGESYLWHIERSWAVVLDGCREFSAAASRYWTSVYDSADDHWLVGRAPGSAEIPASVRTYMLGADPDPADPAQATDALHRSACERGDDTAKQARARIPEGRTWDLLPLRRTPQAWHDGPVVAQVRVLRPEALDEEGLDWPRTFEDEGLQGIGVLHPSSDAPRVELTEDGRDLVSVRLGRETAFAVVEGTRHRFVETTHGCLSGDLKWVEHGDGLAVATIAGLDDAPAKDTWMILGHERSGIVVVDLRSGLSHELVTRRGGGGKLSTAQLRARLAELSSAR